MTSIMTVIIDISEDSRVKVTIYDEKGLKTNETEVRESKVQLISPDYVIVSKYMTKNGVLIVAKNVRNIRLRRALLNLKM